MTHTRRARGPTIHDKLIEDVTELAYLVRNRLPIPRVLLKNGKCALRKFIDSRDKDSALALISEPSASLASRDTTPAPVIPVDTHAPDPVTSPTACLTTAAITYVSAAEDALDEMAHSHKLYNKCGRFISHSYCSYG